MNSINTLAQENEYFSEVQTTVINRWLSKLPSYAEPIDLIGSYGEDLLKDASFVLSYVSINYKTDFLNGPHLTVENI